MKKLFCIIVVLFCLGCGTLKSHLQGTSRTGNITYLTEEVHTIECTTDTSGEKKNTMSKKDRMMAILWMAGLICATIIVVNETDDDERKDSDID